MSLLIDDIDIKEELFEKGDGGYLDDDGQYAFELDEATREVEQDKEMEKVDYNGIDIVKDDEEKYVLL